MKILWLTWKDSRHPLAGGAEVVHDELATRLAKDGHEVVFIVPRFPGSLTEETWNGYRIIRVGNSATVYWEAYKLYKKQFKGWADVVIDSYFVVPFFAKFYVKEKTFLFVHNLCRQIWFYQMFFPASLAGYILEPIYLQLIRGMSVIAVSESTKKDLVRHGFKSKNIQIVSEGIEIAPIEDLTLVQKFPKPTLLSLGSLRPMKRTDQIVKAFEIAKETNPDLELVVAGKSDGKYGEKVLNLMKSSRYADSIRYLGPISKDKKIDVMQKSHLIAVASIKEGWGLIVTEANSQGTPAVVYDVDGLRDSVQNEKTGIVSKAIPQDLAMKIGQILRNPEDYSKFQKNGWEWSKDLNFDSSYINFITVLKNLI
jgi:glycosyltransferase involved in cell wall biosynthesis